MRSRFAGLILLAAAEALVSGPGALAEAPSSPYPLLATPASVARLVEAWNREAPYVQGEVLVKFKGGAFGAESRALSCAWLGGRPDNAMGRRCATRARRRTSPMRRSLRSARRPAGSRVGAAELPALDPRHAERSLVFETVELRT